MTAQMFILPAGEFIFGILLGGAFGVMHDTTLAMNKIFARIDQLASDWAAMPGPLARSTFLLVMLTQFQVTFTLLFGDNGFQWIISAGVVLGYALTLLQEFRQRSRYRP